MIVDGLVCQDDKPQAAPVGLQNVVLSSRALWEPDPRLWDGSRLSARPHGQDLAGSS